MWGRYLWKGKREIKSRTQEKLWYNVIRKILPNQENIFMAYISSKEFKVLLEEIVKMLKEGKSDEVIKMLEEKIK